MTILRNVSNESLVISKKPPFHILPGRAVDIPNSLLKTTQINNLMKMGLLKPVRIQVRAATILKKAVQKTDVKKEEKKEEKKTEAVRKKAVRGVEKKAKRQLNTRH